MQIEPNCISTARQSQCRHKDMYTVMNLKKTASTLVDNQVDNEIARQLGLSGLAHLEVIQL